MTAAKLGRSAAPGYKVLVLHAMGDNPRRAVLDHVYCYAAYRPGNLYVYHHLFAPVTPELRSFPFDAVIINYCFLAYRTVDRWHDDLRREYGFLGLSDAVKIALAQDECTRSAVLDEWLHDFLKVDVIYTPYTNDLAALYPRCFGHIPIKHALAGYSNPRDLARLGRFILPFRERPVDIGLRVRHLPAYYGRQGVLKGRMAERFRDAALAAGFAADISTRPEDVFIGDDWFRFLGSCRFTFLTRAGASMHDPDGTIRSKVEAFVRERPQASFDEIEAACFPGLDRYDFSCVSPRLFEAAAARTGLILLEGDYVEGLEPHRHYIPLKADFSNLEEVFALMRDADAAERMIAAAYQHLVASERFSYAVLVDDVIGEIAARRPTPRPATATDFANLERHYRQLDAALPLDADAPPHWSRTVRWAARRAEQQGWLAPLAELAAAGGRAGTSLSLIAGEIASFAGLDPGATDLAVEAVNALLGNRRHLEMLSGALKGALSLPASHYFTRDWLLCQYVYEPGRTPEGVDER